LNNALANFPRKVWEKPGIAASKAIFPTPPIQASAGLRRAFDHGWFALAPRTFNLGNLRSAEFDSRFSCYVHDAANVR
jgi:hypothetical protein